ncbi:MAG: HPr kinase/phosphorylase [Rhodospirillales bacterium]|jgi:serine kinase of HPr protein (carbohydrate metabolism regulator)
MTETAQIHGTCIAIDDAAIVLLGPPGCGKSDLALRLIDAGATLIADDRIDIKRAGNNLIVSPPVNIAGLIEVRGIGIVKTVHRESGVLTTAFELVPPEHIERMPQPLHWSMLGLSIPKFKLDPFASSAGAKIRIVVRNAGQDFTSS